MTGLKKLLIWKSVNGHGITTQTATATGNPATFTTTLARPLVSCNVSFAPVQEGSGEATPSNVRPITGWTGLDVYHSGADISLKETIPVSWQSFGTVYGGTLDVTTGELVVMHNGIWMSDANVIGYNSKDSTTYSVYVKFSNVNFPEGVRRTGISNRFTQGLGSVPGNMDMVYWDSTHIYFSLPINELTEETLDGAKAWFVANPTLVVYELRDPVTYLLTPETIRTFGGTNIIWSNANGDIEITYKKKG